MSDYRDWARRAKTGDEAERRAAFDMLARDFRGLAYRCAYGKLSDPQLAEDAAQEALLTAWQQISQLQDAAAFPQWLRRIVLNKADGILRRQPINASMDEADALPSEAPTPEAALEAREMRQRLRLAVAALPAKERDLTRDFYFHGETQREISERLDIPLATVKKRLQYARERLRGLITGFSESLDRAIYGDPPQQEYQPAYVTVRTRDPHPPDPSPIKGEGESMY